MSDRCPASGCKDEKGVYQVSGGLPDLSFVPNVLPGRCHNYFTGQVYSGCGLMGVKNR
jgi:hypothetical protein